METGAVMAQYGDIVPGSSPILLLVHSFARRADATIATNYSFPPPLSFSLFSSSFPEEEKTRGERGSSGRRADAEGDAVPWKIL